MSPSNTLFKNENRNFRLINYIYDKGFVFKNYKEVLELNKKERNNPI